MVRDTLTGKHLNGVLLHEPAAVDAGRHSQPWISDGPIDTRDVVLHVIIVRLVIAQGGCDTLDSASLTWPSSAATAIDRATLPARHAIVPAMSELRLALDQVGGYEDLREALGRTVPRPSDDSDDVALLTGPKRSWRARIRPGTRWLLDATADVITGVIVNIICHALTQ